MASPVVFNRYWICDRSGIGHEKWKYFAGDFDDDVGEAKYYVIHSLETWAIHAEAYGIDVELNVIPPHSVVRRELGNTLEQISHLTNHHTNLAALLRSLPDEPDPTPK